MSKKVCAVSDVYSDGSKPMKHDYYWIIKHQYQKLRGRLMNLAETLKEDQEARMALKGIFHDYLDDAHYTTQDEITKHLVKTEYLDEQATLPIPALKGFGDDKIN